MNSKHQKAKAVSCMNSKPLGGLFLAPVRGCWVSDRFEVWRGVEGRQIFAALCSCTRNFVNIRGLEGTLVFVAPSFQASAFDTKDLHRAQAALIYSLAESKPKSRCCGLSICTLASSDIADRHHPCRLIH